MGKFGKDYILSAQRPLVEQEVFKINLDGGSIQQKIRKKVVLALCWVNGEPFDMAYLNDLPLQLMPRVLEMIQEHTYTAQHMFNDRKLEKDALARLFHTLRKWELPLFQMIPHWQKLFKAVHGRTSINEFTLIGISLPISVLDIMFPALQSINLEQFGTASVGLGRDEFVKLSSFIKDNTSIKTLCIGGDTINDTAADSLSDAVKGHPTLQALVLVKSGLNDANILGKVLEGCSGLNELRLIGHEKLGLETVALVAEFIRCNHPMEGMYLQRNKISDNDTLVLASALTENTNLKVFKINKGDYTIGQKIRKKVVLALCRQDGGLFDLSHFNDLPLQLMPRVLELIQEHSIGRTLTCKSTPIQLEKDAMTRLFHTLRGWELPLLFENLKGPSSEAGGKKRKRRKTRR